MKRNPATHRTLSQLNKALAEINASGSTLVFSGETAEAHDQARIAVLRAIESISQSISAQPLSKLKDERAMLSSTVVDGWREGK